MKAFAELIETLDSTNKTNEKVNALAEYFREASSEDALWTIALLSHRRPPRPLTTTQMREWAAALCDVPDWLFEETYHIVGDLAETIALIIPSSNQQSDKSLTQTITEIIALKTKSDADKKEYMENQWQSLNGFERFVFNKIITGGFRIGISQKLMTRALSRAVGIEENSLAHRIMGEWTPQTTTFDRLILNPNPEDSLSQPYPFYLAYALEGEPQSIGEAMEWMIEHKWDGMRGQLIVRKEKHYCWSRGEELITDKFPEFECFAKILPSGTVIDGEILPYKNNKIQNFAELQKRIGRKNITKKILLENPVILMVYDLLECDGKDLRDRPLSERKLRLEELYKKYNTVELPWAHSAVYRFDTWKAIANERDRATEKQSEGLMLKKHDSPYGIGRKKGNWWKWKSDPLTIDAVLTYAMRGHGRRTNLFTDYTFALWKEDALVTFAKAYSGLTDKEFKKVDAFVRKNTLDRFGPVRQVIPELVFEIAFEGIANSSRHKSGVAVRFPRILRWRHDKKPEDADTIDDLKAMIVK